MRRTPFIPVAVAALSLLATALAPAANAAPAEEVVTGLVTPLSLAVADDGTVYVAQNFAGMLTKASPGEEAEVIHTDEAGREVGAVSVEDGTVTFATTALGGPQDARVWTLDAGGDPTMLANLFRFEKRNNPDGKRRYGILGLDRSCKSKFTKRNRWLLPYKGIIESHPYASNVDGNGVTYVADAAANAIFGISDAGKVSTLSVLPPTKVTVTGKFRKSMNLPRCAKGRTMRLEAVPTDVELGPDGDLYVTTLPGGPEDPSLGANGRLYKISPSTGATRRLTGGLVSPVGLAIAPDGTAYVSQLFASSIVEIPVGGDPVPYAEVPFPGDVEVSDGYVYATETDLTNEGGAPAGKVLRWSTGYSYN